MTAQQLQYLKDTQDKAIKVIESCETKSQLRAAKKYINLLGARRTNEFNLNELSKVNPKDYRLCNDMQNFLQIKVRLRYKNK